MLDERALNRALLARQGLLSPMDRPLPEAVDAIGAVQAQHWPAPPVALWSRLRRFNLDELQRGLAGGELVVGHLLRNTLHLVSARRHPFYAAVVEASGASEWRRTPQRPSLELARLQGELARFASSEPRSGEQLVEHIERWLAEQRPELAEAELARQRQYRWRPLLRSASLVRVPADGRWNGARTPAGYLSAPAPEGAGPSPEEALEKVVAWHLAAFGPAGAEDVASWIGWRTPPIRAALERIGESLLRFEDEAGRSLYDLPSAPRPDPSTPAPVRLLPWFDSVLLAYGSGHRRRILPDAYRERAYVRANLQWLPTFLVDGLVAGSWSPGLRRRVATLTLSPFRPLPGPVRDELVEEAERLLRFMQPSAGRHLVLFDEDQPATSGRAGA